MLSIPNPSDKDQERFWSKVQFNGHQCWNWLGGVSNNGYGRFCFGRRGQIVAHRVSFQLVYGLVPEGLVLDHICHNRICVNPVHLRIVTKRINAIENSNSMSAKQVLQTHCIRGHPLSGENLFSYVDRKGSTHRECKECRNMRNREWIQRKKHESHCGMHHD